MAHHLMTMEVMKILITMEISIMETLEAPEAMVEMAMETLAGIEVMEAAEMVKMEIEMDLAVEVEVEVMVVIM